MSRLDKLRRLSVAHIMSGEELVFVVRVPMWLIRDPFDREVVRSAVALTYGHPVVLLAVEPCGCRELSGRTDLITALNARGTADLEFESFELGRSRMVPRRASN